MTDKIARMKELSSILHDASRAYYQEDREIMSNYEYDALYDELVRLEQETGTVLAGSPTVEVGYESLESLEKERHESPMLSLGKTKDRAELAAFAGEHDVLVSWKLDGLTVVLTYQNGSLIKGVTRGNGEIGEVITNNVKVFRNVPHTIPFKGDLIIRGEAVISYSDFNQINQEIEDIDAKYKNPRNLCSGSVRQLNNEITARRNVYFYAFSLVMAEGFDACNSHEQEFIWLKTLGFDVVEYKKTTEAGMAETISYFEEKIKTFDIPSDGLVVLYDNISYGQSLGRTAKFPRDAIAFKWMDETKETVLREIEWSPSRTGLINPVAIFDPVELEGTTVSRASVHNLSMIDTLELGIGDHIVVYKANMIIPQIAENLTRSGKLEIPGQCPACGGKTEIHSANDSKTLHCTNPECSAKKIKSYSQFVNRDAMNIEGLSEATLEKMIAKGFIHSFADIYQLERYKDDIVQMEGFGEKSYENLIRSINQSRHTSLARLIYSLGIPNIGVANAKVIAKHFDYDLLQLMHADMEEISSIDKMGDVIAASVVTFFQNLENQKLIKDLLVQIEIEEESGSTEAQTLDGLNFVVTGSVSHFANRNELKAYIEERGGKVTGSVTSKTNYLINNDTTSSSSKNKKAKELGIEILSEEAFLELVNKTPDLS